MKQEQWNQWVMQTARHYGDIQSIIHITGIPEIDDDHRKVVGQVLEINRLMDNLDHQNFGLEIVFQIGELCNRLRQSLSEHFQREENLMKKRELSTLAKHTKRHQEILHHLDDMIADLKEGKLTVTHRLKEAILDWVVVHFNQEDQESFSVGKSRQALFKAAKPQDLPEIFQPLQLPNLDEIHGLIHQRLLEPLEGQEHWQHLADLFAQAAQAEGQLVQARKIGMPSEHTEDHRSLAKLAQQGL